MINFTRIKNEFPYVFREIQDSYPGGFVNETDDFEIGEWKSHDSMDNLPGAPRILTIGDISLWLIMRGLRPPFHSVMRSMGGPVSPKLPHLMLIGEAEAKPTLTVLTEATYQALQDAEVAIRNAYYSEEE